VKGEREVRGSDFELPPQVELANPNLHLATITDKHTELNIEIKIEKGIGYEPKEQRHMKKPEIGVILLDAIFTPIKNVNFHVESMRVGERTDFDKLSLEVETDDTISPEEAFYKGSEILIKHFTLIFEGKAPELPEIKKSAEGPEVAKTSIEDLKLSTRTLNALLDNNIKTVGGILKKSEKTLSELDGMGNKAISEIKRKLKKLGLELKPE
jgi:DNA-directed RNA polymerase subunit alpha